ncbi:MAG: ribonuclease P protein component [Synergistaceae bacterium]|nr:ribonuclease P protein component [Synergistaceae bacterium]MBQ9573688.1 ribonuclease P protein component [Synergistaceae bacterium]
MPRVTSLRKGREFDEIFRTGTRLSGLLVRMLYLRDDSYDAVKLGCAVGKRQGKAHIRVRGRRILREAFRSLSDRVSSGLHIVLMLTESGLASKSNEVSRELEILMRRRKLLVN